MILGMTEVKYLTKVTYIDPTVTFFSHKHLYVISFCSVILFFIIIMPPIILLIVYPTWLFEKVKSRLSQRQNLSLLTFVETFQGCYEDGTNGTRDYRAVSGWLLATCECLLLLTITVVLPAMLAAAGNIW